MQVNDDMVRVACAAYRDNAKDGTTPNLIDMRAALTAALAAMWRPISEAPKDRPLLVTAYIVPSEAAQRNGSEAFWDIAIGRAYGTKLDRWPGILGTRPSHWTDIPSPPKAEG